MEKQIPIPQSLKSRWTLWLVSFFHLVFRYGGLRNFTSLLAGYRNWEPIFPSLLTVGKILVILYVGLWGIVELVFALPFKWMIIFTSILFQSINLISYFTNLLVLLYIYICIQIHWLLRNCLCIYFLIITYFDDYRKKRKRKENRYFACI